MRPEVISGREIDGLSNQQIFNPAKYLTSPGHHNLPTQLNTPFMLPIENPSLVYLLLHIYTMKGHTQRQNLSVSIQHRVKPFILKRQGQLLVSQN